MSSNKAEKITMGREIPLAVILGCAGSKLSKDEQALFKETKPFGLILFERNCVHPDQVKALTNEFRHVIGQEDAPVFIDQEGGRVTRLKPPHWRHPPPAQSFVDLAKLKGEEIASKAIQLNFRLIAEELHALGINVDCTPVLDIPITCADPIIGDRALGNDLELIEKLATAICDGLLSGRVFPVIKHIPGHGRALVDSHTDLPTIDATFEELMKTDFEPFRILSDMPLAMTAHIIFSKIDENKPVTVSRRVIEKVIRGYIGYDGLLISDDLSMQALSGSIKERTREALDAGCDLVLHCNGKMDQMTSVVAGAENMTNKACERWSRATQLLPAAEDFNVQDTLSQLNHLMVG